MQAPPGHLAKMRSESTICIYCGGEGPTRDHIPPRNLFGKSPGQLVTVPSCVSCNSGSSPDDEYFRAILTIRRDVETAPLAAGPRSAAERTIKRPASQRFAAMLSSKIGRAMVRTPAGLVFGPEPTIEIDQARIARVLRRVVLGLYYHQVGTRLSPNYDAFSVELGAHAQAQRHELPNRFRGRKAVRMGNGEFEYRWLVDADDASVTEWCLRFFDRVIFIGTTWPVDDMRQPKGLPRIVLDVVRASVT
jgi:hypothetical protein